jgi:hypothetical protein
MLIGGKVVCNYCGRVIPPDEITVLEIKFNGHVYRFDFHSTPENPCLKMKLHDVLAHLVPDKF